MKPIRAQRGIALLTAIVLVALATVLAVSIAFGTAMTARRGASSFTVEQGLQIGAAAEDIAAFALLEDAKTNRCGKQQQDCPVETWTTRYGPAELAPDVAIEAQLEDESGKFNLNSLIDANGDVDPNSMEVFLALLEQLGLESKWGPLLADWIDKNLDPLPGGGEDNVYTLQQPAYRVGNSWLTSPSELMSLPEFGRERYLRLLPHVTALPPEEITINVCFATAELLDALLSVLDQSTIHQHTGDPKLFAKNRQTGCFPALTGTTFKVTNQALPPEKLAQLRLLEPRIVDTSAYFRLHTWVSIGTTRFALYSLLRRTNTGNREVRVVSRTFGTE